MTTPKNKSRKILRILAILAVIGATPGLSQDAEKGSIEDFPGATEYPDWKAMSGAAQESKRPLTLEQINEVAKTLGWRIDNPDTLWGSIQASSNEKAIQCMKVTGNEHLCRCLTGKLPAFFPFRSYVGIVTGEKNMNFSGLTAEEIRKLIDITIEARDLCIAGMR